MSELERKREEMMERQADDLPFGGSEHSSMIGRTWFVIGMAIVLALAIPIFFAFIGLSGAAVSTAWGPVYFIAAVTVLGVTLVGLILYVYRRATAGAGSSDEVRSLMNTKPVVCGALDSIEECALIMYTKNVGFCPVIDEHDRCVGVVTDRDLVCGGVAQGLDMKSTPVTLVMERNFKALAPDDTSERCLQLMEAEGVRRVPVLEDGRCVGVISMDDLILEDRCTIEDLALIIQGQQNEPNSRHDLQIAPEPEIPPAKDRVA